MSVSLEEVLNHAGYDIEKNVEDAEWLIGKKDEFEELIEKAEELKELYDDYEWDMKELEDSDEYGKVISFEEWRRCKNK